MLEPSAILRAHGGLAATHELYAGGFDRRSLAAAVREGRIRRVRQGWFCDSGTAAELVAASRVGGPATCRTALRLGGVWTMPDSRLHVAVSPHAVRLRTAASPVRRRRDHGDERTAVHWSLRPEGNRLLVPPIPALRHLAQCGDEDELAAAADSILHADLAARTLLLEFAATLPSRSREAVSSADGVCESGIETALWRWFRRSGVPATRQVGITGIGRVDFVIGRRLAVEVDGAAYHTDPARFEDDRRRDALLSARGFRVLRFSYRQVIDRRSEVERAILAAIARGDADE